ncbi:winged helix DNA-binding protein, partial [Shewanella algae]|uniref:winged helix DNA-binding protein n=1 Tax=Shewanella algae TaxID=38313 RepID=UPI00313BA549
ILKGKHPEKMCVKDIGCRMIEKSSNVPRIIDRLALKKLVKRSDSEFDKRETVITLTQSGIAVLEATSNKVNSLLENEVIMD